MSQTQTQRILTVLRNHEGLCAMGPLHWSPPIVRVAARIYDLREQGHFIDGQPTCPEHDGAHHAYYKLAFDRLGDRLF